MNSKTKAEATLAKLPLSKPVAVADVDRDESPRRHYSYTTEAGNLVEVEIGAEPTPRQLADLVAHLPLPEDQRMPALALMAGGGEPSPTSTVAIAKGAGLVSAGAAILEIIHQLGVIP